MRVAPLRPGAGLADIRLATRKAELPEGPEWAVVRFGRLYLAARLRFR